MGVPHEFETLSCPTLWIDPQAWAKLSAYVEECPLEVNGFGYLQRLSPRDLLLAGYDSVFITDQVVTVGTAEVTSETTALALYRAMQEGRADDMSLQWHSHGDIRAYHSATDLANIERYGRSGAQWMVSLVLSRVSEPVARMDVFAPVRMGMQIPIRPYVKSDATLQAAVRADLERHVQQRVSFPDPKHRDREVEKLFGIFEPVSTTLGKR